MSVKRALFIKFLNGDLLRIECNPDDGHDMICKHIIDYKPELDKYELTLFPLNNEDCSGLGEEMMGIYIKRKPLIEIQFIEPLNSFNINRFDLDGYAYTGMIQKYRASFTEEDETRHDFIFYYDKFSNKFAYDTELQTIDIIDRGRSSMEGYCKWPSIEHMLVNNSSIILPPQIKMQKIMYYSNDFQKEWDMNLAHFAKQC